MAEIKGGNLAGVRQVLEEHPELIGEFGPDLLECAAANDRVDVLPMLVAAGADVNAVILRDTALTSAARSGAVGAAAWLLEHGADVNGRASPKDATPLHRAVVEGRLEMVKLLLERGADPNMTYGNPARNAAAAARFWRHEAVAVYLEGLGHAAAVVERPPVDVEAPAFRESGSSDPGEWFEQKWWHVYDYATRRGLEKLGERNRLLYMVGYLIDQLVDGGTVSVYYNPSGAHVVEIAEALDRIGAARAAEIVRAINALFPGGAPAADTEARAKQMERLPPVAEELGAELEEISRETSPRGERRILRQLFDYYRG
jgi:hypothetical protein